MIKRSTIDFILDNVPIDEVVKEYVTLHKRGNNLFGLCPFHNEKLHHLVWLQIKVFLNASVVVRVAM